MNCPECGHINNEDAKICKVCAKQLPAMEKKKMASSSAKKLSSILLITFALASLAFIGLFFFLMYDRDVEEEDTDREISISTENSIENSRETIFTSGSGQQSRIREYSLIEDPLTINPINSSESARSIDANLTTEENTDSRLPDMENEADADESLQEEADNPEQSGRPDVTREESRETSSTLANPVPSQNRPSTPITSLPSQPGHRTNNSSANANYPRIRSHSPQNTQQMNQSPESTGNSENNVSVSSSHPTQEDIQSILRSMSLPPEPAASVNQTASYRITTGSFRNRQYAEESVKDLDNIGVPAMIVSSGQFFRVISRSRYTESQADAYLQVLYNNGLPGSKVDDPVQEINQWQ